ncbi:hypothetical protein [Allorhodopirellula solitaria]|uniref:Uncharacterized protein n=1 Tax=Allorhodopirellula solitaria TaxID=2527987 RepID=A0A5C5X0Q7_9BACT|nr:hypothetical protein [Allorhodopirellula solitaria]TWT56189.1 hypothetical protein CA85_45310 [Allorhodopirellula solitaria]
MIRKLLTLTSICCLCTFAPGCSDSGPNTVNQPEETKTIEQQLEEDKVRAKEEAAELREQAQYN